jgi:succinoglycan biosynthesis transport protein ExoP
MNAPKDVPTLPLGPRPRPDASTYARNPVAETQSERTSGLELRDYFRILSQRRWTAILVFLVVVGGALALSYRQKPVYESEAQVLVPPPASGVSTDTGQVIEGKANLETEAAIATSTDMATAVATALADTLGLDPSDPRVIDHLLRSIEVAPSKAGDILLFRAEAGNAEEAATIANQFADSYLDYRRGQNVATLNTQLKNFESQRDEKESDLEALPDTDVNLQARTTLQTAIDALNARIDPLKAAIQQIKENLGGVLIEAKPPSSPARPNHLRDGVLAGIVGLLLGFGAAFLRDYVDDSLRGVEDVERQSGTTLIGVIPHVVHDRPESQRKRDRTAQPIRSYLVAEDDPKAPATEAYRTLRTNLLFMSATGPLRVLLVTSPLQGEGKSTTAANLAAVLAQAGQRVLLVGADLRRPSVHQFFGLSNRVGLSSVLSGQAEITSAVQDPRIRDLRVLPGGPVPPNPAELLGSPGMRKFLEAVKDVADWIVLDGPPVLGLADALVLSAVSDGTLMVVNEATNRRILSHARDQLLKVQTRSAGAVLNNFGPAFSYYYSDYYAYSSSYYQAEERATQDRPSRRERKRRATEAEHAAAATLAQEAASAEAASSATAAASNGSGNGEAPARAGKAAGRGDGIFG